MSQANESDRPKVVLDKSYLRGASLSKLRETSDKSSILITDALLYETTKDTEFFHLHLDKLTKLESTTYVLPYFGRSLRWEAQNREPSPLASTHGTPRRMLDYAALRESINHPDKQQMQREKAKQYDDDVDIFLAINKLMANELESSIPSKDSNKENELTEFERRIADDQALIQGYADRLDVDDSNDPKTPLPLITKEWATYRFLQVYSLFSAEKWSKDNVHPVKSKKTLHDVIDMQYLLHAVREGGFASKEKKLKRWFLLLRPDGTLFE